MNRDAAGHRIFLKVACGIVAERHPMVAVGFSPR